MPYDAAYMAAVADRRCGVSGRFCGRAVRARHLGYPEQRGGVLEVLVADVVAVVSLGAAIYARASRVVVVEPVAHMLALDAPALVGRIVNLCDAAIGYGIVALAGGKRDSSAFNLRTTESELFIRPLKTVFVQSKEYRGYGTLESEVGLLASRVHNLTGVCAPGIAWSFLRKLIRRPYAAGISAYTRDRSRQDAHTE